MEPMNQGVRKFTRPCSGAGGQLQSKQMLRDLFHPDYDRRLWHLTRSADPATSGEATGARGLLQSMMGIAADTAGGEFRPALRTLLCSEA